MPMALNICISNHYTILHFWQNDIFSSAALIWKMNEIMNRTIISIEVQDEGSKEANIIVRGGSVSKKVSEIE